MLPLALQIQRGFLLSQSFEADNISWWVKLLSNITSVLRDVNNHYLTEKSFFVFLSMSLATVSLVKLVLVVLN